MTKERVDDIVCWKFVEGKCCFEFAGGYRLHGREDILYVSAVFEMESSGQMLNVEGKATAQMQLWNSMRICVVIAEGAEGLPEVLEHEVGDADKEASEEDVVVERGEQLGM